MRKICLVTFYLLIFLASLNISFAKSDLAFAKDSYTEAISSDSAEKINYELPYPGLLPDNPLYFLRVIRDKIVGFLIADPLKKAEFNLLQADKRLNAGIYLFNKGKVSISISTISKAENYFEESLGKAKKARQEGMEIQEMTRKLIDSSKKHQEELSSLEEKAPKNFKTNFSALQKRVSVFETEASSLGSKR